MKQRKDRKFELKNQCIHQKIAIVTGASGGIGKEFVCELMKEDIDKIWVVGRNAERLSLLQKQYGDKIVCVCKDLTDSQDLLSIEALLVEQNVIISYLINNAGIAQMKPSKDLQPQEIEKTILLNCYAPVVLTNLCLPFMKKGSIVMNISSASAFQPVPYINLYAATKSFEKSYSLALNEELKNLGINVIAVCPSWVDTDMLIREIHGKKVKFPGIVTPKQVVIKAMEDAKMGKELSICSIYVKCQYFYAKFMPRQWIMKIWMRSLRKLDHN